MLVLLTAAAAAAALCGATRVSVAQRSATAVGELGPIDAPGHYDLQFGGAIGANALRRAERVLGYAPTDYVPPNRLRVWVDSAERGARLLAALAHVRAVHRVGARDRRADLADDVRHLRVQHRAMRAARLNAHKQPLNASTADAEHAFHNVDSFEFDSHGSGALVVQLRVVAHNASGVELVELSQPTCRTRLSVRETSERAALLTDVHCDDAERVAEALAQDPRVARVELRAPFHSLNAFADATLRSGAGLGTVAASLDGAGQLLALSDTGVAHDTCFFADADATVPVTVAQAVPRDTGHRKLRAYWSGVGGDLNDAGGGHGTHVAGTALGAALPGAAPRVAEFGGAARGARLAVIDLLAHGSDFLAVPLELDTTLMRWSADVGARVHSASWGAVLNGRYSADEQALDRFAWHNRHFLMVFAAGNSGPAANTVVSPAMAKNVLAIGATMNGVESVELAQRATRPTEHYSPDWLASYSSRGSRDLSFRKPDLVAPGGPYVWSAAHDAPANRCGSLADSVAGLAGTSMATPLVAGGALLLRQYFADGHHPDSARTGVDVAQPTASLLRAALAASAQPMRGTFPNAPFANDEERIDATGHGRVALDALLESERVQLAVLSNEDAALGLLETRAAHWCVEVLDGATGAPTERYDQLTVSLAYADYPSTPTFDRSGAALVNDLRLAVADGDEFRVNEQDGDERRSTIERARVAGAAHVSVTVVADTIGFGDVQTFSLVVVLQRAVDAPDVRLRISAPSTAAGARCAECASAANAYRFAHECAVCGNGLIEPPAEECDSTACCDSSTCRALDDASACVVVAGDCRLRGVCERGACAIDADVDYAVDPVTGVCEPMDDAPPPAAGCVYRTAAEWRVAVRANRALVGERRVCCAPLWAVLEQISFDEFFDALAHEYTAATLNAALPGAVATPEFLLAVERARELLESTCGVGLIELAERDEASELIGVLRRTNDRCVREGEEDASVVAPSSECALADDDVIRLNERVCSGGGVFDRSTGACACHSNRHPGEPDCAHLACAGHGASLYNYTSAREECVCLDGWAGATCAACAAPLEPGLVRHCVGLPFALAADAPQQHVMALVDVRTLRPRLAGSHYPPAVAKHADGRPGRGELDCWCRAAAEQLSYRAFDSHIDALRASMLLRQINDELAARAAQQFADAAQTPAASTRTSSASAASAHRPLLVAAAALAALAA